MKTIEAYQTDDGEVFKSVNDAKMHEELQAIMLEIEAFVASDACDYKGKQQKTIIKNSILAWNFWKANEGTNQ